MMFKRCHSLLPYFAFWEFAERAAAQPGLSTHFLETRDPRLREQPVFANRFHVTFSEYTKASPFGKGNTNSGSLHFDFEKLRQVWVHGKGQTDNWCQCAGLKTNEACHLISAPSQHENGGGAMYIVHKSLGKCCKLGDYASGFGPLRPDWLRTTNASKGATTKVGDRTCTAWAGGPPGDWFMMISDDWSADERGLPCQYADHFKWWARWFIGMSHVLTFNASSYSESPEPDDIFGLPESNGCEESCPNNAGGWCKA